MSENVRVLRVVVASPSDVHLERELVPDLLDQLNRSVCRDRGILLRAVCWETDTYPGFDHLGPQGLIDPILRIEECDILIGIFWKRFGTPVSTGESGTEHEINRAYESWKGSGRPHIMLYFNEKNYRPRIKADVEQLTQLFEFRDKFLKHGLFWRYNGKVQFKELLRSHLTNYILNQFPIAQASAAAQAAPSPSEPGVHYFAVQARVIAEYDRTFIGRAEAQNEFDTFLKTQPRGYFIARGGPGQGKTALSCHLIRTHGYVHHLVSRTGGRSDTRLVLRSLLSQINPSAALPEPLSELTKMFEEALAAASSKHRPLVVVIDALDELPLSSAEPSYLVSDALPEGVFFFVTSRPGDRLDRLKERLFATPHHFHDIGPLSLAEMRSVLQSRRPEITTDEVERIAEASQGNPLYLRAVADQLSLNPKFNLHTLPGTIEDFFRSSIGLLRNEDFVLRQVLGLLSVVRASLSIREISAITGHSQREIDEQGIRPIRQFLLDVGGSYTFFHTKFHEFVTRNVLYEDELRKSHLAVALWLQRPKNAWNSYRWASLAHHMFESGERSEFLATINPAFLAEKVRRLGYAVLEDIELCTRSLLETGDPSLIERCVSLVEGLREIVGGDIIPDAVRAIQQYRAGPESFRTKLIEPEVSSVPGLEAYVGLLPKAEIPADFFEIVPLGGRLAVAIGDVPSIGIKSAFVARFIANLFHRLAEGPNSINYADLLTRLNSTIAKHDYFRRVSMLCLEADPARGVLHIANAGHPYPVHYSGRRAKCDVLPVRGDLLHDYLMRPANAATWEQYSVEIEPGDIIVLMSDGLTEGHLLTGDPYAYRFTGVVESHAKDGPRAIGEAILDDWRAHMRQEDSADDVSVVVIKFDSKDRAE